MGQGLTFKTEAPVVTTGSDGKFTITFPAPFPAVCSAVLVTLADGNGTACVGVQGVTSSAAAFTLKAVNAAGVGVPAIIRVSYLAVGY